MRSTVKTFAIAGAIVAGIATGANAAGIEKLDIGTSNAGCEWKSQDFERANVTKFQVRGCESGAKINASYDRSDPEGTYRYSYRIRNNHFVISVKDGYLRSFRGRFENGCRVKVWRGSVRKLTDACDQTRIIGIQPIASVKGRNLTIFSPFSGDAVANYQVR